VKIHVQTKQGKRENERRKAERRKAEQAVIPYINATTAKMDNIYWSDVVLFYVPLLVCQVICESDEELCENETKAKTVSG